MLTTFLNKQFLKDLGVHDWGYNESEEVLSFSKMQKWVDNKDNGVLGYLADHRLEKRENLKNFYPDFQSSLVFVFPYWDQRKIDIQEESTFKLASYVTGFEGKDYHHLFKQRLEVILAELKKEHKDLDGVFTIDAQPVMERDLAYKSSLGWFGKNSMLINKEYGSYFLIAGILLNKKLNLEIKEMETDHCGNCTSCIEACPTNAIDIDARTIIADRCISTFTIELFKEATPPTGYTEESTEVFGCDICQDICPWNQKQLLQSVDDYKEPKSSKSLKEFFNRNKEDILNDLESLSNRAFRKKFVGTPLERTGRIGLIKNIKKGHL